MDSHLLIGCVGKPSAGKSSFLNACTDANAKVGNYPFTTIKPNNGISFYLTSCPCAKYDKTEECSPRYGKCVKGKRYVPVKILDVAGLIPGASEGYGLGNKFLDDLRTANVLLHIVDASGTTNEKGESTKGYNPINDIVWLHAEIVQWIFGNLWEKWPSVIRRHTQTKSSIAETLLIQLSGYSTQMPIIHKLLAQLKITDPCQPEDWDRSFVYRLIETFVKVRFPTIIVLNKIDLPTSDANVAKICSKYSEETIVVASALSECFLKKARNLGYIHYGEGDEDFITANDQEEGNGTDLPKLKQPDPTTIKRLEKLKDLILFRYGSTGVQEAIQKAVESQGMIPVFPVKSLTNFQCEPGKCFQDCFLVKPNTSVRAVAHLLHPDIATNFQYAECAQTGLRMGEGEVITNENNIIKFYTKPEKKN